MPSFAEPSTPALAAIFERIRSSATAGKEAAAEAFDSKREEIQSSVAAAVEAIQSDGEYRAQQIEAELQEREEEICGRFESAREGILAARDEQCAAAQADELAALAELQHAIADKRRAATEASELEAQAAEESGLAEADRTWGIMNSTQAAIESAARQAISSVNAPDDDVREEVESEVEASSREVTNDLREKGEEVAAGALETGRTVARGIREAGLRLAESMDEGASDVEQAIREGTGVLIEQIDQQAQESLARLEEGESQFAAGLADARAQIVNGIRTATQDAAQRMQEVGELAIIGLDSGRDSALAGFDDAAAHLLEQLAAAEEDVPPENAEMFERQATELFAQLRAEIELQLDEQTGQVDVGVEQAAAEFGEALTGQEDEIRARVDQAIGELHDIDGAPQTFIATCQQGREQLLQERTQYIQQWGTEADGRISEAQSGWSQQRATAESEVRAKVNEFQTQAAQIQSNAPGQFQNAAAQAVASANRSIASQIWEGIKEGFSRFFEGMTTFLLIFLVVFVACAVVLAVIAGGISGALLAAAALLALVIVGVGYLIYGLIMAAIHRIGQWMAAPQPWWAKIVCIPYLVAVIVGDVLGVTPILEGIFSTDAISLEELSREESWARITQGLLTLVAMLLLRRAGKAAAKRGAGWRGGGRSGSGGGRSGSGGRGGRSGGTAPVEDPNVPPVEDPNVPPVEDPNVPPVEDPNVPPVEDPNVPPVEDPNVPPVEDPNVPPVEDPNVPPVEDPNAPVENPNVPTIPELYAQLSEQARRGFDQTRELTSPERFQQMEGAFRNPDGSYDVNRANRFFEDRILEDAEYQRRIAARNARFQQQAREQVDRINNTCGETEPGGRPHAALGDGSSEAALTWEAENGRPWRSQEGHYLKIANAIATITDAIAQLGRLRQYIDDPAQLQTIDAATVRGQGRVQSMRPSLGIWNNRVTSYPQIWEPNGTSRVQPGWPTHPGPI